MKTENLKIGDPIMLGHNSIGRYDKYELLPIGHSDSPYNPEVYFPIAYVVIDIDNRNLRTGTTLEHAKKRAKEMMAAPELLEACKEFVRKVECGEARSKRSYAQMKQAIKKAEE